MRTKNSAFTLVEILIVVIILGILAAIVIPQFTEASNDARKSALSSDLQTLRSQIELFKVQHGDMLPGCARASDGTVAAWDATVMVTQMTSKTDMDGNVSATGQFGPYLQTFPTNPFVSSNANKVTGAGTLGSGTTGWYFSATTGKMSPNDSANSGL